MLSTNILRIQLSDTPCFRYESLSSVALLDDDHLEIKKFLEEMDNNIIYDQPYVYANNEINVSRIHVILSRGLTTEVVFESLEKIPKYQALHQICGKFIASYHFLNCPQVNACFNPFEQKNDVMPGLSIEPVFSDDLLGIAILPINMEVQSAKEISNAKMLLNYEKGKFYSRSEIVKVDKNRQEISFRNGDIFHSSLLRKIGVKNVSGFPLAQRINNYFQRLKHNCQTFMKNWGIQLDTRFIGRNSQLLPPGNISFRGGVEKQLNDLIFPMARNTYNHYFRLTFKDVAFDDDLTESIVVFVPSTLHHPGKSIAKDLEKATERMQLKAKVFRVEYEGLEKRDEVVKLMEGQCRKPETIYTFIIPHELTKQEEDNVSLIKQELINRNFLFHFIEFNPETENDETDIIGLRNLSVMYTKVRKNPWKLRQIPFGEKPTIACNVNVQETLDGHLSVAIVSTMNAFFSKYSCFIKKTSHQNLNSAIFQALRSSLEKFQASHKIIPFRIFLYRTGTLLNIQTQFSTLKQKLTQFNAQIRNKNFCVLTYISLNKSHPYRSYTQTDDSHITYHTVKKTQLLSTMEISQKHYIQLQFDEPALEMSVFESENDPTFIPKVLQLTVKLCFGSVGNSFGKGMGFLDYGRKLNSFRNMEIATIQPVLREGIMLFL